jgi:bifunctional DNA-binding transcriptional regulator/antitoxin component of YhaV-PrlF toxin-antitoxin module
MPRLVKGGKFVYGLTRVGTRGTVVIPSQAMEEYEYHEGDTVIVMSGSRRSGGFGLAKPDKLVNSHLDIVLKKLPGLPDAGIPEARPVSDRGRLFCTTTIKQDGCIQLPPEILSEYGIQPGDLLVAGRGSHIALAFIARGPIMDEALKHPELEVFGIDFN